MKLQKYLGKWWFSRVSNINYYIKEIVFDKDMFLWTGMMVYSDYRIVKSVLKYPDIRYKTFFTQLEPIDDVKSKKLNKILIKHIFRDAY